MRLVLFTTSDLRSGRGTDFARLVESLAYDTISTKIRMFVLLQHADETDRPRYERLLPRRSMVQVHSGRLSLSAARNRLLRTAMADNAVTDDCIVGFPDDDCWYPPGFVRELVRSFAQDSSLDMLACRVSLRPASAYLVEPVLTPATALQVVRRSSSNSMFFRGRLAKALGAFDPRSDLEP